MIINQFVAYLFSGQMCLIPAVIPASAWMHKQQEETLHAALSLSLGLVLVSASWAQCLVTQWERPSGTIVMKCLTVSAAPRAP